MDVTTDIEKNKLNSAVANKGVLQLKYLDLELRSIKLARLGKARETIAQAEKEGAKSFAPRTLAIAEKSLLDTDAFITANRHDTAQVNSRSDETTKSALHLLKITGDSKPGKKTSSEDQALRMESEQNNVAVKQGELNANEALLVKTQGQLDKGADANLLLAAKNSDLESDQALNKQFEDARAEFTSDEAEVYKQGNVLTIRLRRLGFPVAQAVLTSSNFPLLAKVQTVIKNFGKISVTIEGHTDSNGGKALNSKLSTERAKAIKEYLLANNADYESTKIDSIGYDYQKPLATNKIADGRAQNRRVDILIQTEANQNM